MITRNLLTGFFLVTAVLTQAAMALSCPRGAGSVSVLARGPAGLRIEAKGCELSVGEEASALTFRVSLAPLETGIGLRDRHLRELLEADRYPAAILRVARSELTFPKEHVPVESTADGELMLHGRSRPVKVHYRAELDGSGATKVRGSFRLDIRDFDLLAPSYLGVSVAPDVEVSVELLVDRV